MSVDSLIEHLFRQQASQMVATLTRALGGGHLALAEEAVQDAMVTALQQWPFRGVPDDPAAWLFRVARNRALDRLRHQRVVDDKLTMVRESYEGRPVSSPAEVVLTGEIPALDDDQLGMMFLTCHPALPRETRVALTLKIVGGFGVGEIARAFLVNETAIQQRLVRAKRVLRDLDVPFGPPSPEELTARLDSVLEGLYLMFNEGYAATVGDGLLREDIASEAVRLTVLVTSHPVTSMPCAWALRALLLLHMARFGSRVSSEGDLFLLRDQDRTKWDGSMVREGLHALDRAASGDGISRYHLEAEIAACHAVAQSWPETDWPRILECYTALLTLTGSPIVRLNAAIARSQVDGPRAAIAEIEHIVAHPALATYHLLPAVLAELWREAGETDRAAAYYRHALALVRSAPERRFLATQLEDLGEAAAAPD
jgi:RNA polymerase sigma-70 factor, ECF subfamily